MKPMHNPPHMSYYRLLERDLDACFRFIEPVKDHLEVYSDEFSRLILCASAEIENALKAFASSCGVSPIPANIFEFLPVVTARFPRFTTMELFVPRCSYIFSPWAGWTKNTAPEWWSQGYNKIKHDRLNYPKSATLQRAIESIGALQVVLLHLYRVTDPEGWIADRSIPEFIVPYERHSPTPGASSLWRCELPDDEVQ
jgi:hypothetical protein